MCVGALALLVGALLGRLLMDVAPVHEVAAAVAGPRGVVARLTGLAHTPLASPVRGGAPAQPANWRVLAAAARAQDEADRHPDGPHLQALGVAALLSLRADVAVHALEEAATADATSAAIQSDLAAAYLTRAEQPGHAIDVPRALVAADRAIRLNSRLATGHFNYALALERLHLRHESARAWDGYLARFDDGGGWAREARDRRAALDITPPRIPASPAADADARLAAWAARAVADPDGAPRPDLSGAGVFYAAIAEHIARVQGSSRRRLAEVVSDILAAEVALAIPNYGEADRLAASVIARLPDEDSPLRLWATRLRLSTGFNTGRATDRQRAAADLAAAAHRLGFVALEGDARHRLGAYEHVAGNYEQAIEHYSEAVRLRRDGGDRRGVISTALSTGDALLRLGRAPEAWEHYLSNLAAGPVGEPVIEHARLVSPTVNLLEAGHGVVALALAREAEYLAEQVAQPGLLAEALYIQARAQVRTRNPAAATLALAASREALDALTDEAIRDRYRAELSLAAAEVQLASTPTDALQSAAEAEARFGRVGARQRLLSLAVLRARALRSVGHRQAARAALEDGVRIVEAQQNAIAGADLLPSFLDATWDVFSELVDLEADAGDSERAVRWLDRGFDVRQRWSSGQSMSLAEASRGGPVVAYLPRPNYLWIWVVRDGAVHQRRVVIGRDELVRRAARLSFALTNDGAAASLEAAVTAVAREVWWPVAALLAPGGHAPARVALVLDPVMQRVPFALLPWNGETSRTVLDVTATVLCPSVFACAPAPAWSGSGATMIALHAGQSAAGLAALPLAREEAERVSRRYAGAGVEDATEPAFVRALATADVVHFAGHAIPDERYPGRSELLLVSPTGEGVRVPVRRLLAGEVRARLIVLSACRTSRAEARRGEGGIGVAGEFLRAGADALIATLWDVKDDAAGPFMESVHDALTQGAAPWDAVRVAQKATRHGSHTHPRDWSGYVVYTSAGRLTGPLRSPSSTPPRLESR